MFGSLGGTEILVILVLALLLFGPRRLPQIGQTLGKALSEFRRATHEFRSSLEREVEVERLRETTRDLNDVGRELRETVRAAEPRAAATPSRPADSAAGASADPATSPDAEDLPSSETSDPAAEPPAEPARSPDDRRS